MHHIKIIGLLLLICFAQLAVAQQARYPRDTSYTLQSAYQKLKKENPFIKPVLSQLPKGVEAMEGVVYRSLGSRSLYLDIFYPKSKPKNSYPGILLVHGGGWRTGDKSLLTPMAQQLAAHGYVAATVEYRLSPEAPYPAAVQDIKAAIRWLRAHAATLPLDTTRFAIYGTSAGGQLAALVGTTAGVKALEGEGQYSQHSSAVQAIIDVDGVLAFKHPESEEGSMAAEWLGGTYEEKPNTWTEASALTHAGKNTPPTLFIGSSFPRFLAGRKDMVQVLQKEGVYTESHFLPDTPHSFWLFHPWFEPTLQHTIQFLDKIFEQE